MLTPQELFERGRQQMEEQQREFERAYRQNVEVFTRMFLGLGTGCIVLAESSRHDQALAEAKSLAAHRWSQLLDMEQQIPREEARLAARPKTRPTMQGDDLLPDRTLEQRNADWQAETDHIRASLDALKEQAKVERRELESLIVNRKAGERDG
jgi:hypothetical protein